MDLSGDPKLWPDDLLDRRLVGEWRFDRNTGLILPDWSGHGNHGAIDGADWVTRSVGPALQFVTANTDFVDTGVERIGGTGLFCAATEQFTVEISFIVPFNEEGYIVARAEAIFDNRTFGVYFSRPGAPLETPVILLRGAVAGRTQTNWSLDDGNPHTVWITWDGTNAKGYYDGGNEIALNVGAAAENVGQRIVFGARTNGTGWHLDGDIFTVRISDRALTAPEVAARYQKCTARASGAKSLWMIPFIIEDVGVVTYTVTAAAHAVLKMAATATAAGQAVLKEAYSKTAAGQAWVQDRTTNTAAGQAVLKMSASATAAGQAVLKEAYSKTAAGQAYLVDIGADKAAAMRAILKEVYSKTAAAQAWIQDRITTSAAGQAVLKEAVGAANALQAYLIDIGVGTGIAAMKAILKEAYSKSAAAQAILKMVASATSAIKAYLQDRSTLSAAIRAIIKGTMTPIAAMQAYLSGAVVKVDFTLEPRPTTLEVEPRPDILYVEDR